MAHFARIDKNNIVTEVIVVAPEVITSGVFGDPEQWVQTSYNTYGGVHTLGGTPFRKNFAAKDMIWDPDRDAFYTQKPFASWVLNETTCYWEPPIASPGDTVDEDGTVNSHKWDEATGTWIPFSY